MRTLWILLTATAAWGQSVYSGSWTGSGPGAYGVPATNNAAIVAPSEMGGNDSHACTLAQPCLTPQHATAVVRGMPGGKHVVLFRGGTYPLSATWSFDSGDSGTSSAPMLYQNYGAEIPVITGGRQMTGTWTRDSVTACAGSCTLWYQDIDANPSDTGYFQDFESLFYNGVRRPRPQARSGSGGYLTNACAGSNSAPICVAGANQAAADSACGCPAGAGPCSFQSTPCAGGTPWMCFNRFLYSGADLSGTWHGIALGDIEILNFEIWSMGRGRLASASGGTAALTGPMALSNGNNGCLPGHAYVAENVKEKLAAGQWYLDRCPGCASTVSTPAATWRLYIAAAPGEDPNVDTIVVPAMAAPGKLLSATGLHDVIFRGLEFQADNWMPGPYGLGDSQGMPLVPAAVSFTDSSEIKIEGVKLNHIQGWGIEFLGTSSGNEIMDSAVYDAGAGGIRIGSKASVTDSDTSVPKNNLVMNTAVAYYGRLQPTGEGAGIWLGDTHGNTVTHNDIFNGYTGCIEMGYGLGRGADDGSSSTQFFAYNNTVSWNRCYGQGQNGALNGVLSDFGGIYAASSLSANCPTTGQPSLAPTNSYCNHILYNVIHDLAHNYDNTANQGAQGIYLDQGTSNVEARFNLVYRISHTCAFNNTPQHTGPNQYLSQWNLWDNNIFAYCGARESNLQRVVVRNGSNQNSLMWSHNVAYYNAVVGGYPQSSPGLWGCFDDSGNAADCATRFKFQSNDWWNVGTSHGLTFSTCKTSACGGTFPGNYNLFGSEPWASDEDQGSISVDPQFVGPTYGNDNWHMQSSLSTIGFQAWDYTQAGRTQVRFAIPSNVPDLFPQRTINAAADF